MPVVGGILGFFAFLFLFDIATEVTKIRKLLEKEVAQRRSA